MLRGHVDGEVRDDARGSGGDAMAHLQRRQLTAVWDDRLDLFRTVCTITGTAGLMLVIGQAAVSLGAVLRTLIW
jgi:hypothetical protein